MANQPKITSVARDPKGRFTSGISAPGVVHEPMLRDEKGKFLPRSALASFNQNQAAANAGKAIGQAFGFSYLNRPSAGKRVTDLAGAVGPSMHPTDAPITPVVMKILNETVDQQTKSTDASVTASRQLRQAFDVNTQAVQDGNAKMGEVVAINKDIAKQTRLNRDVINKMYGEREATREKNAIPLKSGAVFVPINSPAVGLEGVAGGKEGGSGAAGVATGVVAGSLAKRGLKGIGSAIGKGVSKVDTFFGAGAESALQKGFGSALLSIAPRLAMTIGSGIALSLGTDFFIKGIHDAPLVREREEQKERTAATNRAGVAAVANAPTNTNTIFGNDPKALKQYNALTSQEEREKFLLSYGIDAKTAKSTAAAGAITLPGPNGGTNGGLDPITLPKEKSYMQLPGNVAESGTQSQAGTTGPGTNNRASQIPSSSSFVGSSDIPPQGKALLDTIATGESHGDYTIRQGGSHMSDLSSHPGTIGPGGVSSAAGKYQFIKDTWATAAAATGVKDFTPQSQDKAAWWLAQHDYKARTGRDLATDVQSNDPKMKLYIAQNLNKTWTSLPGGSDATQSGGRKTDEYLANMQANEKKYASNGMAIGDSIAVGVGKAGNILTSAKVGDSPQAVLDRINGLNDEDVKGKSITLSSGYSNNPSQVALVQKQIDALKAKGAGSIKLLGVGDRPDLVSGNDKLSQIAQQSGVQFGGALDPSNLAADHVHPKNYSALASSASLETPPQSSTGQAIVSSTNMRERLQDAASVSRTPPIVVAPTNNSVAEGQNKTGGSVLPPVRNDDPVLLQAMIEDIKFA